VHLAPLSKLDVMVMDRAAPPSFCKSLAQMDIELVIADFA